MVLKLKILDLKKSQKLLIWGLTNFETINLSKKDKIFDELDVWQGKKNKVKAYTNKSIYQSIPKAKKKYLKVKIKYNGPIQAPINKDDKIADIIVTFKDEIINEYPLFAYETIKEKNIIGKLINSLNYLIWGDV